MHDAAAPDRFGGVAGQYAAFRPRYPRAVFHYLAAIAPSTRLAIDVAAGSGQATGGLRERFSRVLALDMSARQLSAMHAADASRLVARAEQLPIRAHSADLIVAAQALHWFDTSRFFRECGDVLRPGGVLAALVYGQVTVSPAIDPLVRRLHDVTLAADWAIDRASVMAGYPGVRLPGRSLAIAQFVLEQVMTADAFLGYLSTWSAVSAYRERTGADPLETIRGDVYRTWGDAARVVRWPLRVRASRV
jgi:SAM-dependent methyltransferase